MHIALEGTAKELDFANVYEMYVNDIYRLCFSFMKNHMDAEDAVQETFLKYYHSEKTFDTLEHKKAWLIVTASNQCKDMLKHWWRQRKNIEDYKNVLDDNSTKTDEMLAIIIELPDKYKTSIYLLFYSVSISFRIIFFAFCKYVRIVDSGFFKICAISRLLYPKRNRDGIKKEIFRMQEKIKQAYEKINISKEAKDRIQMAVMMHTDIPVVLFYGYRKKLIYLLSSIHTTWHNAYRKQTSCHCNFPSMMHLSFFLFFCILHHNRHLNPVFCFF